ncbi:MAG TPA: cyanophycinase [Rubricoccaceae bacterium]|jgi:cyanophycinase
MLRVALIFLVLVSAPARAQSLVIIGGGDRPPDVVAEIVRLGRGERIVVVPAASGSPAEVGAAQASEFTAAGFASAAVALGDPDADSTVALFSGATAVFFSGGDQNRLVAALHGTRTLAAIRTLWARGGVVAGTSAGAAVMSSVMLTGDERREAGSDEAFTTVQQGNVVTAEGFGFVAWAVVDQHFAARRRQNRLISVVLDHPDLVGVGIDEATAVVVSPDGAMRVAGAGSVQVFDAREAQVEVRAGRVSAAGLRVHVLASGDVLTPEGAVVLAAP